MGKSESRLLYASILPDLEILQKSRALPMCLRQEDKNYFYLLLIFAK